MILITSNTWRGHHRPERCFEVYGLAVDDSRTHLVNPDFPLRYVALGEGRGESRLSASYWFQSTTQTTDDYASRIWSDLKPRRDRWLLVSILFDETYDPNATDVRALYLALHESVAHYLRGG
jgi:exosortase O